MEKVKQKALTFDDVLLLPRYSDFIPSEASTQTKLTKNINIKVLENIFSFLIFKNNVL